jgi:membrane-associated protein
VALLAALPDVTPLLQHAFLLGMDWMDPNYLLDRFGTELLWVSLLIVFVECGLFFPFLPGDTLLLSLGVFIATDDIDIFPGGHFTEMGVALLMLIGAAMLGNIAGYEIGRAIGHPLRHHDGRILKKKYFDQTHEFFEKHGSQALVIGRFVPFVRTYVTVVAGVSQMKRHKFLFWSFVGAVLWVLSITLLGYFLGTRVPWLRDNIDLAILTILALSVIPVAYEWRKHRRNGRRQAKAAEPEPTPEPATEAAES